MWQNSWFMIRLAWTSREKKVLVLCLLSATLTVALNLVHLYVSPAILAAVERHAPVAELLCIIAGFALGSMLVSAASAYVKANTLYGRISVRTEVAALLNRKAATTSYPNVDDDGFQKLLTKAHECVNTNTAAAEAIWDTLTKVVSSLLGFAIYVSLLTTVQPFLILVILATSSASYFIGNYVNGYGYRHREEESEYVRHLWYISERSRDLGHAKDIRIFGLRPWLEELYHKTMDAYTAFHRRTQGVYLWAKVADLVLTFLRSAVAYAYLIRLVLRGGLGVAEFLLYFTAAGGFTEWVSGILDGFHTLYQQSLDLSTARECLDYREPFLFDGGKPVNAVIGKNVHPPGAAGHPFLLLDEPTAALDPIAESELYRKYNDLAQGRSSIYISHRLASTRFCDRIILIDNGKISEEGTHGELLEAGGKYAELYEIQSKYYKEGAEYLDNEEGKAIILV